MLFLLLITEIILNLFTGYYDQHGKIEKRRLKIILYNFKGINKIKSIFKFL